MSDAATRAELFKNAVAFLKDEKTQVSPVSQRIQFLESKGLTAEEIDAAIRQSNISYVPPSTGFQPTSAYSLTTGSVFSHPLQPQPWDWRDYFIVTVVSGTFVVGAISLAQKYLMPYLKPPSSTAYEADKDSLTAQFDAAEALLKEIQTETSQIKEAMESQNAKVQQATTEVDSAVKEMREGDAKTREEMREIREEVKTIRDMLPKMIERNKESHGQSLAELQQELKSLKALLLSRPHTFPSTPSASTTPPIGRPTIPAWQLAPSSSTPTTIPATPASTNATGSSSALTPTPAPEIPVSSLPAISAPPDKEQSSG